MAISINQAASSGSRVYGYKEFYLDTPDDLIKLGTYYAPGSKAYVISNSDIYTLNSQKQWIKTTFYDKNAGSGGGSGSGDIIYDGGAAGGDSSSSEVIYDGGKL